MDTVDLLLLAKLRSRPYQAVILELAQQPVSELELGQISFWQKQIQLGYPVAYLLGQIKFLDRMFEIDTSVLIPRPETEDWVQLLITKLKKSTLESPSLAFNILEIGTGSGVIGLCLSALLSPNVHTCILTDISLGAIQVATRNEATINAEPGIEWVRPIFIHSDLLQSQELNTRLDLYRAPQPNTINLLVANLPYVTDLDRTTAPYTQLQYEPSLALYAGKDGLNVFRRCLDELRAKKLLFDSMWFELDPRNIHQALELCKSTFPDLDYHILCDFNHQARVLVAFNSRLKLDI